MPDIFPRNDWQIPEWCTWLWLGWNTWRTRWEADGDWLSDWVRKRLLEMLTHLKIPIKPRQKFFRFLSFDPPSKFVGQPPTRPPSIKLKLNTESGKWTEKWKSWFSSVLPWFALTLPLEFRSKGSSTLAFVYLLSLCVIMLLTLVWFQVSNFEWLGRIRSPLVGGTVTCNQWPQVVIRLRLVSTYSTC